jgi:hypothetical protein
VPKWIYKMVYQGFGNYVLINLLNIDSTEYQSGPSRTGNSILSDHRCRNKNSNSNVCANSKSEWYVDSWNDFGKGYLFCCIENSSTNDELRRRKRNVTAEWREFEESYEMQSNNTLTYL